MNIEPNKQIKGKMEHININNLEQKIIADGNCLFRSFAYFLYKDQEKHRAVRLNIVSNTVNHWESYKNFLIGDESHTIVIRDKQTYENYMSLDRTYESEVEIKSFVDIYQIHVIIYRRNFPVPLHYGENAIFQSKTLTLLLSGDMDKGHYDVINCYNLNFWDDYLNIYNHSNYEHGNEPLNNLNEFTTSTLNDYHKSKNNLRFDDLIDQRNRTFENNIESNEITINNSKNPRGRPKQIQTSEQNERSKQLKREQIAARVIHYREKKKIDKQNSEILISDVRRRGRPSKIPILQNNSKRSTDTLKVQIVKNNMITDIPKRRGRPRKVQTVDQNEYSRQLRCKPSTAKVNHSIKRQENRWTRL